MINLKNIFSFLAAGLILSACVKIEHLPPEPSISFRSFEVFDTTDILGNAIKGGRLKFYFEDGDGDLGMSKQGFSDYDTINLFVNLLRVKNNEIIPAPDNDPLRSSGYRIPYMERTGQNKILRGIIKVTFFYFFWSPADTIYYDFYLKDRAGHFSNTERTCQIILNNNGICTR
ncbi:MAG TPA: hypothetical protein PLG42_05550 [Bacteroidales bacterium]|nr:hypothetical protein [Bacteroidales bacterium]